MKVILRGFLAAGLMVAGVNGEGVEGRARTPFAGLSESAKPTKEIEYHGGPLLLGATPIYVIYYGNRGSFPETTPTIVNEFLSNLGGSPQYNFNTTYYDSQRNYISNALSFSLANVLFLSASGKTLSTSDIPKVMQQALTKLPVDPEALYILITAPDVKVAGFCSSFCAYHTHSTKVVTGVDLKYALVPEPDQKCTACDGNISVYNQDISPNGDLGADEMTDSIMHELSETVTDPDFTAWYTSSGLENGDLCNFNYGVTYIAGNGAVANAHLGQRDYLIQTIWENAGSGLCANTLP